MILIFVYLTNYKVFKATSFLKTIKKAFFKKALKAT